jgi:DNA-binding winged helix-turn-helix (wHTH) protein/PAS domain-containing protein
LPDLDLHQTPFGYVVRIDADGTMSGESSSNALETLIGFSVEELQERGGWQAMVHPDDFGIVAGALEKLTHGEIWEGDLRIKNASGEWRNIHLYNESETSDDGTVRIEGWGHDTTETIDLMKRLHQLEERMRLVIDHVSAFTWTTDNRERFTSLEGAALAMIDIDPEDVIGRTVTNYLGTGEAGTTAGNATKRALKGEVVSYKQTWQGNDFSAIIEPLRDLEGKIIGTLGVAVVMYNYLDRAEQLRNLRSELQHARMTATGLTGGEVIQVGDLVINPVVFAAWKGEKRLSLSPTEFRLLLEFLQHEREALTREQLLEHVWHHKHVAESRLVDMAVKRLRDKIEDDPSNPKIITTVRGVGYRLEPRAGAA